MCISLPARRIFNKTDVYQGGDYAFRLFGMGVRLGVCPCKVPLSQRVIYTKATRNGLRGSRISKYRLSLATMFLSRSLHTIMRLRMHRPRSPCYQCEREGYWHYLLGAGNRSDIVVYGKKGAVDANFNAGGGNIALKDFSGLFG